MSSTKNTVLDADKDVAGYARSSWWQSTVAHIAELQCQLNRIKSLSPQGLAPYEEEIADKIETHLNAARQAADRKKNPWSIISGADIDRAFANIHRAESKILRLTPEGELGELGPFVLANARQHLGAEDPRRAKLEAQLQNNGDKLTEELRGLAVTTLLASQMAEETERAKARSFRNILLASVMATAVIAGVFIFWGFLSPSSIASNICFTPDPNKKQVCPIGSTATGQDMLIVMAFGSAAAAFAAAVSLKGIQGTSTPYSVPLMLVLLRIPVGALAALMGLVLIHGGFVPGLSNLDSGPQIIAWAILFGILQESVTRLVDRQGKDVLDNVRGAEREFQASSARKSDMGVS
ncbi:hypothetical protein [Streptomyces canus]|uniref:hypothetical protein n=1 Tax=Streptomyces canus TaxID=58343 RepID=UPI002E290593|nr:hypothetical protein [Streptomyces canus]